MMIQKQSSYQIWNNLSLHNPKIINLFYSWCQDLENKYCQKV